MREEEARGSEEEEEARGTDEEEVGVARGTDEEEEVGVEEIVELEGGWARVVSWPEGGNGVLKGVDSREGVGERERGWLVFSRTSRACDSSRMPFKRSGMSFFSGRLLVSSSNEVTRPERASRSSRTHSEAGRCVSRAAGVRERGGAGLGDEGGCMLEASAGEEFLGDPTI